MPESSGDYEPLVAVIVDALPMGTPYADSSTAEEVARRILTALDVRLATFCSRHRKREVGCVACASGQWYLGLSEADHSGSSEAPRD